ncbi:hypothetical protein FY134_26575 (plasmid) [Agrobacterium fabrum]|nr:hypothetical protein FY134_26575 [Agrobacterium fabrum]
MKAANGNISKGARALGLTRAKLRHRLSGNRAPLSPTNSSSRSCSSRAWPPGAEADVGALPTRVRRFRSCRPCREGGPRSPQSGKR